jgi:hypothetical protein
MCTTISPAAGGSRECWRRWQLRALHCRISTTGHVVFVYRTVEVSTPRVVRANSGYRRAHVPRLFMSGCLSNPYAFVVGRSNANKQQQKNSFMVAVRLFVAKIQREKNREISSVYHTKRAALAGSTPSWLGVSLQLISWL